MELNRSEQRLIRQAETGKYERHTKWAIWVVAVTSVFVAIRFATLPAHQDYMYLLGFSFLVIGTLAVMAMRDRSRSLQLIWRLHSINMNSSALSASSAVNSLSGD